MPTLDQGPPPPPGVGAPPQATPGQLAGPQAAQPGGVQQAVLEQMMLAEKAMQQAATMMPALAPVIQDLTQQFRARIGAVLQQGDQTQPQGGGGLSSLLAGSGGSAPATA